MKVHGSIQENMKEMQNKLAKSIWYFEEKRILFDHENQKKEKKKLHEWLKNVHVKPKLNVWCINTRNE